MESNYLDSLDKLDLAIKKVIENNQMEKLKANISAISYRRIEDIVKEANGKSKQDGVDSIKISDLNVTHKALPLKDYDDIEDEIVIRGGYGNKIIYSSSMGYTKGYIEDKSNNYEDVDAYSKYINKLNKEKSIRVSKERILLFDVIKEKTRQWIILSLLNHINKEEYHDRLVNRLMKNIKLDNEGIN